jgi:hypothetical protein
MTRRENAMSPLERLFRLEVDFYRQLRTHAPALADTGDLHTSYAIQNGYEELLRSTGPVAALDVERLQNRLLLAADRRDILAASDSVQQLLGLTLQAARTRA